MKDSFNFSGKKVIGDDATDKRRDERQDKRQKEIKAFLGFFQKHYFSGKEKRKHFAKIPEKDGDEEEKRQQVQHKSLSV